MDFLGGIDFVVERSGDPGWLAHAFYFLISPPSWFLLLAIAIGFVLVLWPRSNNDHRSKMSAPVIGMIIFGVAFVGCFIWWLDPRPSVPSKATAPKQAEMVNEALPVAPELEQLRDALRLRTGPTLIIATNPDGSRMVEVAVRLFLTNGAQRSLTYTVHRFWGQIDGVEMPDVTSPNYGGEVLPDEPRTYTGGGADVDIVGPFEGGAEWVFRYGTSGNEPFTFARRVTFRGIYNPHTRQVEDVRWSWKPLKPNEKIPDHPKSLTKAKRDKENGK